MKQPTDWVEKRISQRRAAEAMVSSLSPSLQETHATEALAHELLVHKIELEMQLLELQEANTFLEEARNRYLELYESAPAGFATVSAEGVIREANPSVAGMLKVDRDSLPGQDFKAFIPIRGRGRWRYFFEHALEAGQNPQPTIVIMLDRIGEAPLLVHVSCRRIAANDEIPSLLIVLTDLNEIKQAEAEMMSLLPAP